MSFVKLKVQCPACEETIEVEAEIEPADNNYGADADGNRGIRLPAYIISPFPPKACPACKIIYDKVQIIVLESELEDVANKYDLNWEE